jgi:prepilin-type N-terminal cleavage/methylation domain-containing protein
MIERLRNRFRALARDQRGFTLAELMIVVMMLLVVTGTFLTILESVNGAIVRQQARSDTNDQLRAAVQQLDREIRSGNILYDPGSETLPFYSLRVYTQANAPTRDVPFQCVQWKIEDRQLLRRFWPPDDPDAVSDWRLLAEDIVNRDVAPPVRAFDLDADPNKAGRTLDVTLLANADFDSGQSSTVRIQTSLTGRNTSLGYPTTVCDPAPPDGGGDGDDDDD